MTTFWIIYGICSILNLIFSCLGMYFSSQERQLGSADALTTFLMLISGCIGTLVVIALLIDWVVKMRKEKKLRKAFKNERTLR